MAPLSRSGITKSFFSSLSALLLVAILIITTGHLIRSPVEPLTKYPSPRVARHVTEEIKQAQGSPSASKALIAKRVDPLSYQGRIIKGRKLICLMRASIDSARDQNGGISLESEIQFPYHFPTEGWVAVGDSGVPFFKTALDNAFNFFGIDKAGNVVKDYTNTAYGQMIVDEDVLDTLPTGARFENVVNAQDGAIIADFNKSPRSLGFAKTNMISGIYQWSDAAFLEYREACDNEGQPVSNLQHIFRAGVSNTDTQNMVFEALQSQGLNEVPTWPNRVTFTLASNEEQFLAILGSKNGAGCAYLLVQHKAALGIKQITSVTIWTSTVAFPIGAGRENLKLQLYFRVEPVANP